MRASREMTASERADLGDVLAEWFPEGLTTAEERERYSDGEWRTLNRHFQRAGRNGINRDALVNEAIWLRLEGKSFAQIGRKLGISAQTAWHYVGLLEPSLRYVPEIARRNGRKPGDTAKLHDPHLRLLHRRYVETGCCLSDLARAIWERVGFASVPSARNAISDGWDRLGLDRRSEYRGRRCEARKTQPPRQGERCRQFALLDGSYCYTHADPERAAAHAASMREKSPLKMARMPEQVAA
jgi:hypothetical protein